jgi:hypothetical protein
VLIKGNDVRLEQPCQVASKVVTLDVSIPKLKTLKAVNWFLL